MGGYEVYNDDGSKQYQRGTSTDFTKHNDFPLMRAAFISSCVGYVPDPQKPGTMLEYLMAGTSMGEIYQMVVTPSNSILPNYE